MKKFFYLMMAFAVTASTLTSCEDVPSPYDNPNNKKQEVTHSQANGSGTEADPYNVAALNAHLKSLKADSATAETFVKGKVVAIKELQTSGFGNATYYISDDGTTTGQLYIYRSLDLDNKKFTDANAIKVGDEVVIRGQFVNYRGNTPETVPKKRVTCILSTEISNMAPLLQLQQLRLVKELRRLHITLLQWLHILHL